MIAVCLLVTFRIAVVAVISQAVLVVVVVAVGVVNVADAVVCSLLCNEPITIEDAK